MTKTVAQPIRPEDGLGQGFYSKNLVNQGLDYWPARPFVTGKGDGGDRSFIFAPIASDGRSGGFAIGYYFDWYENLHIIPQRIVLGNVLTVQVRDLEVWNGYYGPMTLQQIQEEG